MKTSRAVALAFLLSPAIALGEAPAPQATPIKPPAPTAKPPVRKLEQDAGKLGYRIKVRPGVPDAGATMTLEVELAELLDKPHPTYGKRRPIDDASLRGILVAPPAGKKSAPAWAAAHVADKLPDAGMYALTFTAPTAGVYTLYLRGDASAVGPIEYQAKLAVGVWPEPADAAVAPLPNPEPRATDGDLLHGQTLCNQYCRKDLPSAFPKGGAAPAWLDSAYAAALSDAALLKAVAGDASLEPMQRTDLLYYLRSLHFAVRDFFPDAAVVMAHAFTINEYGLQRLTETANLKLDATAATGIVFTVYKGEAKTEAPALIDLDDRVARDRLKKADKIGYVVFFVQPGDKALREVGFGLGLEPTYPIVKVLARAEGNTREAATEKALAAFAGQGKFNDAKSVKGAKPWSDKLLPLYLRAAELATMYRADEREFTAFDDEIGGGK